MQFVIHRDNGAQFHWRLMADDGSRLAVSAVTFGSAEDTRRASAEVHAHAGAATGTKA
jgi:uncharacterized protein YegP (UPF0339 family)